MTVDWVYLDPGLTVMHWEWQLTGLSWPWSDGDALRMTVDWVYLDPGLTVMHWEWQLTGSILTLVWLWCTENDSWLGLSRPWSDGDALRMTVDWVYLQPGLMVMHWEWQLTGLGSIFSQVWWWCTEEILAWQLTGLGLSSARSDGDALRMTVDWVYLQPGLMVMHWEWQWACVLPREVRQLGVEQSRGPVVGESVEAVLLAKFAFNMLRNLHLCCTIVIVFFKLSLCFDEKGVISQSGFWPFLMFSVCFSFINNWIESLCWNSSPVVVVLDSLQ